MRWSDQDLLRYQGCLEKGAVFLAVFNPCLVDKQNYDISVLISVLLQSDWHAVSGFKVGRQTLYNIFSEVRPAEHSRMKKPVAKYWTTSSVSRMEPHVDGVVAFFAKQLENKFATDAGNGMGKSFDFGEWCMFCKSGPAKTAYTTSPCTYYTFFPSWLGCSGQNHHEQAYWIFGPWL